MEKLNKKSHNILLATKLVERKKKPKRKLVKVKLALINTSIANIVHYNKKVISRRRLKKKWKKRIVVYLWNKTRFSQLHREKKMKVRKSSRLRSRKTSIKLRRKKNVHRIKFSKRFLGKKKWRTLRWRARQRRYWFRRRFFSKVNFRTTLYKRLKFQFPYIFSRRPSIKRSKRLPFGLLKNIFKRRVFVWRKPFFWTISKKKWVRPFRRLRLKPKASFNFFFKRMFSKFFISPFVDWRAKAFWRVRRLSQVWKSIDVNLRRLYFFDIEPKEMALLWTQAQAGRNDKILSFRQNLMLRADHLPVLINMVPSIRIASILVHKGLIFINGIRAEKNDSLAVSSELAISMIVVQKILNWAAFLRNLRKFRKRKRPFVLARSRPLVSRIHRFTRRRSKKKKTIYAAIKINPWVWNLSFLKVPSFLCQKRVGDYMLIIAHRCAYSFEILPYFQFSDRLIRWYVRRFTNRIMLRPKQFEVWHRFLK